MGDIELSGIVGAMIFHYHLPLISPVDDFTQLASATSSHKNGIEPSATRRRLMQASAYIELIDSGAPAGEAEARQALR